MWWYSPRISTNILNCKIRVPRPLGAKGWNRKGNPARPWGPYCIARDRWDLLCKTGREPRGIKRLSAQGP